MTDNICCLLEFNQVLKIHHARLPVLAGANLGGVGSVGVVLLVLGLSSFT